jgi:hypothetical protein
MNVRKSFVLMAVSLMILCGCDNGSKNSSCIEGMVVATIACQSRMDCPVETIITKGFHRSDEMKKLCQIFVQDAPKVSV